MALAKRELVLLVEKIIDPKNTDDRISDWIDLVISETGCPHVSEYIFYSEPELSPTEVVEKAISYKPIQL